MDGLNVVITGFDIALALGFVSGAIFWGSLSAWKLNSKFRESIEKGWVQRHSYLKMIGQIFAVNVLIWIVVVVVRNIFHF